MPLALSAAAIVPIAEALLPIVIPAVAKAIGEGNEDVARTNANMDQAIVNAAAARHARAAITEALPEITAAIRAAGITVTEEKDNA